jgi:hypothetical protein
VVSSLYFALVKKRLLCLLLPSPSADTKFVLSVLKFLGILKLLKYTQNILGILNEPIYVVISKF